MAKFHDSKYNVLFLLCRSNPDDTKFVFDNGRVLHRSQCDRSFGEWLQGILDFSVSLKTMELDISAFACLSALTIITGESSQIVVPQTNQWDFMDNIGIYCYPIIRILFNSYILY